MGSGIAAALAEKTEQKPAMGKKFMDVLTEVATKEVKKTGKFTIPGLCMLKTRTKPATKAGKKEIRQGGDGEGEACQDRRQGLLCVSPEEEHLSFIFISGHAFVDNPQMLPGRHVSGLRSRCISLMCVT